MTTASITDTPPASDSRDPLIVLSRAPRYREWIIFAVGIGVLIPASHEFVAWLFPGFYSFINGLPSAFRGMIIGLLLSPLIFVVAHLQARVAIRGILATQRAWRRKPSLEVIPILVDSAPRLFGHKRILKQMVTTLRELGFRNRPIIIHWMRLPPPLQPPIDVPIEPIPLDEADSTFHAIELGFLNAVDEVADGSRRSASHELTIRRLRKTYLYTGILFSVVMMSFLFVMTAIASMLSARFDPMLMFFALMLLSASLPLLMGGAVGPAWLLVTGGLVMRKAKKRGMASDVHLFVPEGTSLLIRPLNKRLWQMIVSDEKEFGIAQISDRELTMLLRAWLSPIPPPSVEKLVDLT